MGKLKKHCVYVLINNKKAVYVGYSSNISQRIRKHKLEKEFDSYTIISHHETRDHALLAERSIIKFLSIFGSDEIYNAKYDILDYESKCVHGINTNENNY